MTAEDHHILCSIAGSDATGGAGLQGDLQTFAAFGRPATAVVTAVTVQDEAGVRMVSPIDAEIVRAQIRVVRERGPAAWKTGMLWSAAIVSAVAEAVGLAPEVPLVVDPVLSASAGGQLAEASLAGAIREALLPLAHVVTPNVPEAAALLDQSAIPEDGLEDAALAILSLGPRAVVLTGGHVESDPVVDVVATADGVVRLASTPRVSGPSPHGTGCAFSAALTARLAAGRSVFEAAQEAQAYVAQAIRAGRGQQRLDHRVAAPGP